MASSPVSFHLRKSWRKEFGNVPRVVRECRRVASLEIDCSRVGIAREDSRPSLALVEVEPLLGLFKISASANFPLVPNHIQERELTFGCQWSSLSPPGFSVTKVAARVVLIGKFVESIL